jgi:hypothetical protein
MEFNTKNCIQHLYPSARCVNVIGKYIVVINEDGFQPVEFESGGNASSAWFNAWYSIVGNVTKNLREYYKSGGCIQIPGYQFLIICPHGQSYENIHLPYKEVFYSPEHAHLLKDVVEFTPKPISLLDMHLQS